MERRRYRRGHGSDEEHRKDQALFKELLEKHKELHRTTEKLPNGIISRTTSDNPHLAKVLQDHVTSMEVRFGKGRAIRSWDPLFAALFDYKDEVKMEYFAIENGVEAHLTSDNPKVVELILCHDETLHKFVDYGYERSSEESAKPDWLTDDF